LSSATRAGELRELKRPIENADPFFNCVARLQWRSALMRDALQLWPIFYAADKQSSLVIVTGNRIQRSNRILNKDSGHWLG
jgi:hypothetical protein